MRRWKISFIVFMLLITVTACESKKSETLALDTIEMQEETESEDTIENIYVYVCGAVAHEGVYQLAVGSRVYEAIEKAGGFREDAAKSAVNQAERLQDEARVYVPTIGETVLEQTENDGKINLNKATKEELMTLPGVGESRAESIIQYRNENGGFKNIEDIMQISGIKEGLFEKIKDLIKIK